MKIFISYRRQDSEWVTLSLFNALKQQFPKDAIFKDFNVIKAGEDFTKAIDTNLQSCDVLLVVIGAEWLTCKNESGTPRLFDDGDYVCFEIASAMRKGKKVIPVLINNTSMPGEHSLPDAIKELHKLQAVRIDNNNFEMDVFNLAHAIEEATGKHNQYADLVKDIVTGKVSKKELLKPDSNAAYAIVCMGLGALLLLFNTDSAVFVMICIAIIAAGGFAYFLSRKVKSLWLSKDFEGARQHGRSTKLISLIAPVTGIVLILIVVLLQGIQFLTGDNMDEMNKLVNQVDTESQNVISPTSINVNDQGVSSNAGSRTRHEFKSTAASSPDENTYYVIQNTSIFASPDLYDLTDYFLYTGSVVQLLEVQYPFARVEFLNTDGELYAGWISADDLESYEEPNVQSVYYTVIQNTSIFASPDVDDLTDYFLYSGSVVELIDYSYPFAQVEFTHSDGELYTGWIAADDLISYD